MKVSGVGAAAGRNRLGLFPLAALLLAAGCATQISRPAAAPQASRAKLGGFEAVELAPAALPAPYSEYAYNREAAAKIDELLGRELAIVFPGLRPAAALPPSATAGHTLRIEPAVLEIKFIGGAARFWAGPLAGSSAVVLKVSYRDASTGEVVAEPEFQRVGGAWSGAHTIGRTDNAMLEDVVRDVVNYSLVNR